MGQLLEDKVSDLMAEVRHLEKNIKGLNEQIAEQAKEKEVLNQTIAQREEKIKQQRAEIVDLKNETEELKHASVSKDLRLAITQARNAKGLTQKQLATQLNMQPQVINEYESGKAIPNQQILSKLERILGVKLRGLK